MNETVYIILLWACPILLTILGVVAAAALNAFIKMREDLNHINNSLTDTKARQDAIGDRVTKLENLRLNQHFK